MYFEYFKEPKINQSFLDVLWDLAPQEEYHGTPYTFNKFDDSKWLTGEGAAAHGLGHYSAKNLRTALKYKKPMLENAPYLKERFDLPHLFDTSDKPTQEFMMRNKMSQLRSFIRDGDKYTLGRDKWINDLKELEGAYNNRKYIKGNLYRVNVPNKNRMLWEYYYMDEQPKYIQDKLKPYLENKKLIDPEFFARKNFYDMNGKYLGPMGKDIYKELGREKLMDMGIRGIHTYGNSDGPLNVTFSQNDIKMANTPWQRIMNRLPIKSLGNLTKSLLKLGGETAMPISLGLEYYPQLDLILEKDPKQFSKKYNKYMNIEEGKPGYMDENGNVLF